MSTDIVEPRAPEMEPDYYKDWTPSCGSQECRGMFADMKGDLRGLRKRNFQLGQDNLESLRRLRDKRNDSSDATRRVNDLTEEIRTLRKSLEAAEADLAGTRQTLVTTMLETDAVGKGLTTFLSILGQHARVECQ